MTFNEEQQNERAIKTHHRNQVHLSDLHSHHQGRTSRRWGCSAHWHRGIGWVGMCELKWEMIHFFSPYVLGFALLQTQNNVKSPQKVLTVAFNLSDTLREL